ncbi:hypothetical protein MTP09_07105 [Chryseobacterium suipulveris]|uniref:Uncharacterized protein n=1 Tax=Chryseobacterium suipulveris TaxID=2929800 RepID=A0ABY4BSU4_9FLAO|nr:hypothetical protein [Chryseobacterium suipulveris]UOE41146.1 hypothetical protein MTP09_00425 [Chryseobacterium suipulveris]UOE42261.1 hypothetical protein MTP09_06380 [Chryseobacterium suipulveris]UOE42394.1 hypothetical protein MTP09_07105 [Chryseobacterium suipulveris]
MSENSKKIVVGVVEVWIPFRGENRKARGGSSVRTAGFTLRLKTNP